jgi:hypothetical protein
VADEQLSQPEFGLQWPQSVECTARLTIALNVDIGWQSVNDGKHSISKGLRDEYPTNRIVNHFPVAHFSGTAEKGSFAAAETAPGRAVICLRRQPQGRNSADPEILGSRATRIGGNVSPSDLSRCPTST